MIELAHEFDMILSGISWECLVFLRDACNAPPMFYTPLAYWQAFLYLE
jgi:hypothetical protein